MANVILIIILLLFSGFFSACETSFASVNRIRLKNYAAQGDKKAKRALEIANKYDSALTAILIGNNIVNIASASVGTVLFTEILGANGVGIATVFMTIAVLIFGEIIPKSIAKENAESVTLAVSEVLGIIITILSPLTWLFSHLKRLVSKLINSGEVQPTVTVEELKYIIDEIEDQGVLEESESDLVRSALEFDDILVSQILVPRVNIIAVEVNDPIDEIKMLFVDEMYTRIPVYENNIDNIIGVINEKDFFKMMVNGGDSIDSIITQTMYISELKPISQVLHQMQKSKIHMAIIVDQYGGTQGIVTMEDIIEELVGEIYDENDEIISSLTKVSENVYEVSGLLSINDMLETLEIPVDLIDSGSTTIGGWVMELFGDIPAESDCIKKGIFTVTVLKVEDQKIDKVMIEVDDIHDGEEKDLK